MKKPEVAIVGLVFVVLGFLMFIHHFLVSGRFFDLGDILHHEFFEGILFTSGIVLVLVTLFYRN